MKKLIIALISALMIAPILGAFEHQEIKADGYYNYGCSIGQYEVSYINDSGTFDKVGCYGSFDEAKEEMKKDKDNVVRHYNSLSPTKIIAMNSGVAYSYPGRSGNLLLYIYEHYTSASRSNINYKKTYVANHYEMVYDSTNYYYPNSGTGLISANMNGFQGYVDLEDVDLVPTKFLKKDLALWLGGNNRYDGEGAFYVVAQQNYYTVVQNGNYTELKYVYHRAYPRNSSNDCITYSAVVGPAHDFMKVGDKYYSKDGIDYYSDREMKKHVGTAYNYYQYLPLRSKTEITGKQLDDYLVYYFDSDSAARNSVMYGKGDVFVSSQDKYGCNALLVYAMALHESGYGTSNISQKKLNLFGWNAVDSSPGASASTFSSVEHCVQEQMGINLRGFIDITDGRFFNSSLGNKGSGINVRYASDPYWGIQIASIAYKIDKFANNYDGNLSDYSKYDLALVKTFDASVKALPSSSSKTLYTTGYGGDYQKDFIVIVLGEENGYTKIQSTNAISSEGNIKTHCTPITTGTVNPISTYNFSRSVGYMKTSDLQYFSPIVASKPVNYVYELKSISMKDSVLSVSGTAYAENLSAEQGDITTQMIITGTSSGSYNLDTTVVNGKATFEGEIDLSELPLGTYTMAIRTAYKDGYNNGFTVSDAIAVPSVSHESRLYSFNGVNGALNLCIANADESLAPLNYIDSISMNDGVVSISGVGAIKGISFTDPSIIKHEIVIYDVNSDEEYDVIDAETIDSDGYSINDGADYQYAGFTVDFDIRKYEAGNYQIILRTTVGNISVESKLSNSSVAKSYFADSVDSMNYILSTNNIYSYRYELDIAESPLDYSMVKKTSSKKSYLSYYDLQVSDSGVLSLDACGFIYYLDYSENSKASYNVYLISDEGDYKELQTTKKACEIPLSYSDSYDVSNSCFEASANISSIKDGNYNIFVEMNNGDYYDIVELSNRSLSSVKQKETGNRVFTISRSNVRNRLLLEAETK